jgi:hypothetical protein
MEDAGSERTPEKILIYWHVLRGLPSEVGLQQRFVDVAVSFSFATD